MDIEIFYNKTELRAENDDEEKLLKWIEFRLPLIVKRFSRMMISIKEDIKIKGVQSKLIKMPEKEKKEYNRLEQCKKCLFEYTKNLMCYKGGYQSIDQKETCLLFKPKKENNCKIEIELDPEKKVEIDLISKAFGMDQETFVKIAIEHEIGFVKSTFELNNVKNDLESYYKFEINIDELKKLILVEVI